MKTKLFIYFISEYCNFYHFSSYFALFYFTFLFFLCSTLLILQMGHFTSTQTQPLFLFWRGGGAIFFTVQASDFNNCQPALLLSLLLKSFCPSPPTRHTPGSCALFAFIPRFFLEFLPLHVSFVAGEVFCTDCRWAELLFYYYFRISYIFFPFGCFSFVSLLGVAGKGQLHPEA